MMLAGELAALQAAWATICDVTATVQRNLNLGVPNTDANWQTIYNNIPAVFNQPTGAAQDIASALVDQSVWEVALPATWQGAAVDVRRNDEVTINVVPPLVLTVQHYENPESYSLNTNFLASKPR